VIFNEWTYAVFLLMGVLGFGVLPRAWRAGWLTCIGACFYAFYGGIWIVVFAVEIIISRWYAPRSRMAVFGVVQALTILTVVKYGAFVASLAARVGLHVVTFHPIALPLALSFFTFEFIHYAVDRYTGDAQLVPVATYASFILFFPTMIAGPIKRIQDYAQALEASGVAWNGIFLGARRILIGLLKKSVIADNINVFLENAFVPNTPRDARYPVLCFYILIYSLRIYLDFSAYSDIAIGSARLFGIGVPENFNWPYLARNPSQFWRRWHISLSSWITDYVYVPLGGSRSNSKVRVAINTLAAMTLSGLWHGAAGNFVVWGLYHGLLLVAYRALVKVWASKVPLGFRESRAVVTAYRLANFSLVTFGWVFFAMPLDIGWAYAQRLLGFHP
jgi:alginate O-acetyltransferase complex protein AlgI